MPALPITFRCSSDHHAISETWHILCEYGAMSKKLKTGNEVSWETSQGTTSGEVVKKLTAPREIKGHHVAASSDHPQYLVKSDKTGAEAAHRPRALKKQKS